MRLPRLSQGTKMLFAEYLQRHQLKVPLIKHSNRSVLFLRDFQPHGIEWMVLAIDWLEPSHHPGSYRVRKMRPLHNGYERKRLFEVLKDQHIQWDEYEDYILDLMKTIKKDKIVEGQTDIVLSAWEMFIHSYDSYWAAEGYHNRFYQSIDLDIPVNERYKGYQEALNYFQDNDPELAATWKTELLEYVKSYSHWMPELSKIKL